MTPDPHTIWNRESLESLGFEGFLPLAGLSTFAVPRLPGVYVVLRPGTEPPQFLAQSIAGRFKGIDSTVDTEVLRAAWLDDVEVLYIGKARAGSRSNGLRRRLSQYRRHGEGKPVGHRGGEYVWQLADSSHLLVCWKTAPDEAVSALETYLIESFRSDYGRWPFANRKA